MTSSFYSWIMSTFLHTIPDWTFHPRGKPIGKVFYSKEGSGPYLAYLIFSARYFSILKYKIAVLKKLLPFLWNVFRKEYVLTTCCICKYPQQKSSNWKIAIFIAYSGFSRLDVFSSPTRSKSTLRVYVARLHYGLQWFVEWDV